ncbi:MAG: CoA transferase [Ilumatobacteraceae bacterium]
MGPLAGLRVIDLSPTRVGAQVSQLFADFGADVIMVEPPGGAEMRGHAAFPFWARGKRSIVLDVHDEADRDTVAALAAGADVLIESFRPGVLDRLGLGYAELGAANPGLVMTSISGWGTQGPYVDTQGYEALVLAKLGVFQAFTRMSTTRGRPPFLTVPFASFAASQTALHGTLAALHERRSSGRGQHVETSLLQAFLALDTWTWIEHIIATRYPDAFTPYAAYDEQGRPRSPMTLMLLVGMTSDAEWLQFAAVAPHLYLAKMRALGLGWMFEDDEWKGLPVFEDPDRSMALWTMMLEATKAKSLAEWQDVFDADHDVFAEQFRSGPAVLEHPQLLHDAMVTTIDDPRRGPVRQPGAIVKAAGTPAALARTAPTADEHRAELLEVAAAGGGTPTAVPGEGAAGLPLAGVTILELAVLFAAPQGPAMLTDLGARVIKVESLAGDPIRNMVTFPESGGVRVMQGKESICVDLSTREGLALVKELAADADVVVQGFRAGAINRLGLDYESVRAVNPDVIYVNAPGYGVDGPYGARPAFAPSIGAAAGLPLTNLGSSIPTGDDLSMAEIQDGSRRLSAAGTHSVAQADGLAALGTATAVMFGLVARDLGAGGQELFTSMLNTGAHAMSAQAVDWPGSPGEAGVDADLRGFGPLYRIYDAAEGFVLLAAPSPRDWSRLVAALGADSDLGRFDDPETRQADPGGLAETLAAVFATASAVAWETRLRAAGVGCVEVNTTSLEALLIDSPLGRDGGYVSDIVHPTFDEMVRQAPMIRFSRSSTQALPGVLAGQHTDAVLRELGYDDDAIADLRARKVVG